ncbi:hypothetical protein ABFS83_06G143100 [Erythranthe nasuta]
MSPPSKLERVSKRKIQKRRHEKMHNRTTNNTHKGGATEPITINQADFSLSLSNHVISTCAKHSNLVISSLAIRVLLGLVASGSNGDVSLRVEAKNPGGTREQRINPQSDGRFLVTGKADNLRPLEPSYLAAVDDQIVLSMVAAGSNDPTRNQILGFLKSNSIQELNSLYSQLVTHVFTDGQQVGGPRLSMANGVWVDRSLTLKPHFREIVHNAYVAASSHVDFQTKANEVREEVNAWAERETKGLIKNIVPFGSVDALTRLIFTNAVYFKGIWDNKFDTSMTRHREFFLLNGSSIDVPFMTGSNKQYISEFDGFKVLRMPYKQGKDYTRKFSMYFFLPEAKDGLTDLLDKFASESRFIENHIPQSLVKVGDFRIPKFKIGFDIEASKILKGLGVGLPFSMGGCWVLNTNTQVYVSRTSSKRSHGDGGLDYRWEAFCVAGIFQKAFIEVNEHGTEAAAATATRMGYRCAMTTVEEKRVDFVADHPFLFVVREDISGVVIFIGQLLTPPRR